MEMVMKVNVPLIKRLREEKSWSQEHLAEAAGISLRTIQRLETEGNASAETRLALASALGVDVAELLPGVKATKGTETPDRRDEGRGRRLKPWLFSPVFLFVCGVLMVVDYRQSHAITWSVWPLFGWAVGAVSRLAANWQRRHSGQ